MIKKNLLQTEKNFKKTTNLNKDLLKTISHSLKYSQVTKAKKKWKTKHHKKEIADKVYNFVKQVTGTKNKDRRA